MFNNNLYFLHSHFASVKYSGAAETFFPSQSILYWKFVPIILVLDGALTLRPPPTGYATTKGFRVN